MILFLKDYGYFPNVIIDKDTNNKSFYDLALLYRDMGIKNNAFHLTLLNPKLKGIDPYSENLTEEQKILIAAETKANPWYFLREIARAPAKDGGKAKPIRANRGNIALWWFFLNHCQLFLIQPRQTGKSFTTNLLMAWLLMFRCDNTIINLLTKDDKLRRDNIERLKNIFEEFPEYLNIRTKKDSNNTEEITILAKENKYLTHVPQASPKAAENIGRGLTSSIFHVDEAPFCPNISISVPAAFAAMGAAIDEAKRNDAPYGTIFTTTAGKKDDPSGKYIYRLLQEAAVLDETIYYDCSDIEDLEINVRKNSRPFAGSVNSKNGVYRINATFSHRQLGYSDQWLKQKLEESLSTGDEANRDFFNIWTAGSESSPFSPQTAETISLSIKKPLYQEISSVGKFITNWWMVENELTSYMLNNISIFGLDSSEAIGKDDTTLYLINPVTGETMGTGVYNEINVHTISEHILAMMIKYPKTIGVIEAKNMGVAIINYLLLKLPLYDFNPFTRLFNRVVHEADDNPNKKIMLDEVLKHGKNASIINKYKNYFGYSTAGSGEYSRDNLYGNSFKIAIDKSKNILYDKTLTHELLTLVIRNGRIDHEIGGHDDMVVSWLLCWWFLLNGKNLHIYGLDSNSFLKQPLYKKGDILTNDDILKIKETEYQNYLRKKLIELSVEFENESDDIMSLKIEQQIRKVNSLIILRPEEIYSIDQLINNVKQTKKNKKIFINREC